MKTKATKIPLLEALDEFNRKEYAYFAIPGHRYERGMPSALQKRFGGEVYRYDLTETVGLDDFHDAKGAIKEAQEAAANLFGADACRFCVNGTTALIEAMILATVKPGDEILIARDAHRSAVSGLILSGAKPVWLMPKTDKKWHISAGMDPETIKEALNAHPNAKAVLIVSPTYYGQASDVATIADLCHAKGLPLLIDSAHGTHFSFSNAYPSDSILAGADLVAMSFHKTAGSMTQTSMLFYQDTMKAGALEGTKKETSIVELSAIDAALRMVISSSPSYVLMASLDAARAQLQEKGEAEAQRAVRIALNLRQALAEIPGVFVRGGCDIIENLRKNIDVTRVVFSIDGISGTKVQDRLAEEEHIAIEMADSENIVAVVTAANTDTEILKLAMAVYKISAERPKNNKTDNEQPLEIRNLPEAPMLPREAYFAKKESVLLSSSAGRICADILCPYPPGIPILVPGERIPKETVQVLTDLQSRGIPIQGIEENGTIKVLLE